MRVFFCSAIALASLSTICSSQTITQNFGTGANAFTMDFVSIGNPGNSADTGTYNNSGGTYSAGSVSYVYNIGKYEISRTMIEKANALGGLGIGMDSWIGLGGDRGARPAGGVSWNEAARFVNWLNTSKGYQAAYNFTTSGANDNITLWGAGQYSGSNQYRHKNAFYFLPSVDEWYKAAYGSPNGTWYDYSTGSDTSPIAVAGGTDANTAVYGQYYKNGPADITNAGGLSSWGTMAQGGNVWELTETAYDGINDTANEEREMRGGQYSNVFSESLDSSTRVSFNPSSGFIDYGFRVASVPEPSSLSLLVLGAVVAISVRRKR